ncbi:MAG: hypothetical protein IJA72_00335 [Clostridia bacterium]|nr:hypothetical protein [Clostridia bacterium]
MTGNQNVLVGCYTDVLYTLAYLTQNLYESPTEEEMEYYLTLVEKTSVILKRIGETQVIEDVEQDLEVGEEDDERK